MKNTVIMFIHGFIGHVNEYKFIDKFFKDNGYDTHIFSLSGHKGGKIENVKRSDWIDDCNKNIDYLIDKGYKKVIVVGHSMGGVLGINLSLRYDIIDKIILFNPCIEYLIMKNGKLKIIPSIKQFKKLLKEIGKRGDTKEITRVSLGSINEVRLLIKEHKNDIYKLKKPLLLIHGECDNVIPINQIKNVFDKIENDNKEFIEVKDGSHWILSTKLEDKIYNQILNFVRR